MESFLLQAVIYLGAAVLAVPLANRLGFGSVLGYLIAGVMIGPVLGLVGSETRDLQHFAEFGVVMMLFIVGLELEPKMLWGMRHRLVGLGGAQVLLTGGAITLAAIMFGLAWQLSLMIGMIFSLSSTAIVLQTLSEKSLTKSEGGRASFSVLLMQDVSVIPMLVLVPLLAYKSDPFQLIGQTFIADGSHDIINDEALSLIAGLPGWLAGLVTLAMIASVILGGHFLQGPVFRFIARARLREMFTATALLLVVGIAVLMSMVGLSPALGTFLAGVVLATSEYRHELEADIQPFKGLLLGLFFITVGAGVDFAMFFKDFTLVIGLTLGMMLTKGVILYALAVIFKIHGRDRWLFTLSLAQAGEFGFVLLSFAAQNHIFQSEMANLLALVVALSMFLTPGLFIIYERVIARQEEDAVDELSPDEIDREGAIIIAGLGRFGQVVNRMLLAHGHKTVVLDHRYEIVENMRKFGVTVFYGDPTRPDLLHAAGIDHAKAIVIALDDPDRAVKLAEHISHSHPEVYIVSRARDRANVFRLYAAGVDDIVRETFDSSVRAGRYTLQALGHHRYEVEKMAREFVHDDRASLAELAALWNPDIAVFENEPYLKKTREMNARMELAMKGENTEFIDSTNRMWSHPPVGGHPKGRAKRKAKTRADSKKTVD